jgi:MerR HTH family regulatory protein
MRERKRLIRLLVTDITLINHGPHITAHIRLPGGACHSLTVPRPLRAWEAHSTPPATLDLVDELLAEHPHDQAVKVLNQRGVRNGWGKAFSVASISWLCKAHNIPDLRQRLQAQGMLTLDEIAAQFDVTTQTIKIWQRRGDITGRRVNGRREYLYHPGQPRPIDGRSLPRRRPHKTVTAERDDHDKQPVHRTSAPISTGGAV